ncbi:MAG: ABC transporter ATP-binding protein [Deltaproteobacteria bacterium]|nr:ABC transporter ATP-binding protein [Candidatus Zymogenaceae bacterium]
MSTIIATNLTKDYSRVRALAGVDLAVKEGEVFGFLGPNGAGKTTFIKILLGLVFPTAGGISVFGSPAGNTAARKRIGYLPENMRLQGFLKGREFLDLSGKLYGLSREVRKERADRYLKLLGLSDDAHRPLREYSKGMLQRVGIAQALMHNPDMLLLDEPTSGLDPIGAKEIRDIILAEKWRGKTIFINSHLLSEVERTCDRVAILNHGKLIKVGKLDALSTRRATILMEVAEKSEKLHEALARVAEQVQVKDNTYIITPKDDQTMALIPGIIVETGARMISIREDRESLEDIFLGAIKQEGTK